MIYPDSTPERPTSNFWFRNVVISLATFLAIGGIIPKTALAETYNPKPPEIAQVDQSTLELESDIEAARERVSSYEQTIRVCAEEYGYFNLVHQARGYIDAINGSELPLEQQDRLAEVREVLGQIENFNLEGPILNIESLIKGLEASLSDKVKLTIHPTGYAEVSGPLNTRSIGFQANYTNIGGQLGAMCDPRSYDSSVAASASMFTQSPPGDAFGVYMSVTSPESVYGIVNQYLYAGESARQPGLRLRNITGLEHLYNLLSNTALHAAIADTLGNGSLRVELFDSIDELLVSNLGDEHLEMFLNSEPIRVTVPISGTDFVAEFYIEELNPDIDITTLDDLKAVVAREHPVYTVTFKAI
jgi:hypothetical protein